MGPLEISMSCMLLMNLVLILWRSIFFSMDTILRKIFLANAWKCFREVLMIICEGDSEMRIVVVSASLWRFLDLLTNTEY